MQVFLIGLATMFGLIMAIGAQNAYLLRQALKGHHVWQMVLLCWSADAMLMALGVGGLGALIESVPVAFEVLRWFGVVYLLYFAFTSVRNALKAETVNLGESKPEPLKTVLITLLGFTFLNPHVYLDTVILVGGIANQYGPDRWVFTFGASLASLLWFSMIGFGAKFAAKYLVSKRFWQVLDFAIAAMMASIALTLAFASL